jgi:hypothetical protein
MEEKRKEEERAASTAVANPFSKNIRRVHPIVFPLTPRNIN